MADRYWVGGTGTWDATTTHWSTTSGGVGGASVPTATDNAIFDILSGDGTISILGARTCLTLTTTDGFGGGFGSTVGGSSITVSGSISIGRNTNFVNYAIVNPFVSFTIIMAATGSLTTNGRFIWAALTISGAGITVTVQDDLSLDGVITLTQGSFVCTSKNLFVGGGFSSSNANVRTLNISGTIMTVDNGDWTCTTVTNFTLTFDVNSRIIMRGNMSTFSGGGKSYPDFTVISVDWAVGFERSLTFVGANTFASFTAIATNVQLIFTNGVTQTITNGVSLQGINADSKPLTIQSASAGAAWTLSKAAGTINPEYVSFKDTTVSGGVTCIARRSKSISGNTGITFTDNNAQSMAMVA